ncbi:diguanylate cyclase [Aeoliella mucimassa]|uniref:diguanylate cyclase n=1 Tax=Aeoliella mucimassa TaxID=2527972 RepID=UPI0018D4A544|nr:diguanylate cyclase [Aeoliella mucimassa]
MPVNHRVSEVLQRLGQAAQEDGLMSSGEASSERRFQRQLVKSRLGSAAGLFTALRCKHASTASHSLRVALVCSGWAASTDMTSEQRETLEVAALLHDIGKIGVPDSIIMKPGRLEPEEAAAMAGCRQLAVEMLTTTGAPQFVLDTILTAAAWFDGSNKELPLAGDQIPQAARMLAIVDAFDSMTTDHVYRRARSRERAVAELFDFAGRQFDHKLVKSFAELISRDQRVLSDQVASQWLAELSHLSTSWETYPTTATTRPGDRRQRGTNTLFEQKLVENMHDGVVFVNNQQQIFMWNTGAERLTGIAGAAVCGRNFQPSLLQMSDQKGSLIDDDDCPVSKSIASGIQVLERVGVLGRSGRHVTIDLHVIPVYDDNRKACGATILLHDASSETTLEERCQALHAQMIRDPLTQVANRAEFDRMLSLFVEAHQDTELTCSLIMADIDHFKYINDTFGHQAGDEAIVNFASLLKSMCRSGDLVARYGGEEFTVLCADCDNATAASRAEAMRKKLSETTHEKLANHTVTASFGVTELQPGDTPESMLRRSDRALLQAKDQGRNQVVQLGAGMPEEPPKNRWFTFKPWKGNALIDTALVTNVPVDIAIEKLRGFISDRKARIVLVTEDQVKLEVTETAQGKLGPQRVPYVVEVQFSQQRQAKTNSSNLAGGEYAATLANVKIRPKRERDRRRSLVAERARLLLGSLRSYLMAKEQNTELEPQEL